MQSFCRRKIGWKFLAISCLSSRLPPHSAFIDTTAFDRSTKASTPRTLPESILSFHPFFCPLLFFLTFWPSFSSNHLFISFISYCFLIPMDLFWAPVHLHCWYFHRGKIYPFGFQVWILLQFIFPTLALLEKDSPVERLNLLFKKYFSEPRKSCIPHFSPNVSSFQLKSSPFDCFQPWRPEALPHLPILLTLQRPRRLHINPPSTSSCRLLTFTFFSLSPLHNKNLHRLSSISWCSENLCFPNYLSHSRREIFVFLSFFQGISISL